MKIGDIVEVSDKYCKEVLTIKVNKINNEGFSGNYTSPDTNFCSGLFKWSEIEYLHIKTKAVHISEVDYGQKFTLVNKPTNYKYFTMLNSNMICDKLVDIENPDKKVYFYTAENKLFFSTEDFEVALID